MHSRGDRKLGSDDLVQSSLCLEGAVVERAHSQGVWVVSLGLSLIFL